MQIGCTKKLIDYLGVAPQPIDNSIDPFYCWTASIFNLNRRHTIIVSNDASSYGFVIYGIKKGDLKNIHSLFLEGIYSCFKEECIDSQIIDKYLEACSVAVEFTKTRNAKVLANLNHLRERLYYYGDMIDPSRLLQSHLNHFLNNTYRHFGDNYRLIKDKFLEEVKARYGENIHRCQVVELEITLELNSVCRRRVLVPLHYTFRNLHTVIQTLFGWEGYHLHNFWIEWSSQGLPLYSLECDDIEFHFRQYRYQLDFCVTLAEIFPKYNHIIYHYDLGDNWTHAIELVAIRDNYSKDFPTCIEGEGTPPPEDSGGVSGYAYLLEVANNPNDPDYDDTIAWLENAEDKTFDLAKINNKLATMQIWRGWANASFGSL